jgi:hypothetical protein
MSGRGNAIGYTRVDELLEIPVPFAGRIAMVAFCFLLESFALTNLFVFPSVHFFCRLKHEIWDLSGGSLLDFAIFIPL